MREIKFRAWDKVRKELINISCLSPSNILTPKTPNQRNKENIIIMQYTGLKDKDGKEIYEGDIIRIFDCQYGIHLHKDKSSEPLPKDVNYIVFWSSGDARFLCKTIDTNELFCVGTIGAWVGWKKEIIGNIYENPELLEK